MNTPFILLIDNSNTRTKFMRAQNGRLFPEKRVLRTADISLESLQKCLKDWDFSALVIASVVPATKKILQEFAQERPCHVLAWDSPHGINFQSYPDREKLGTDRIANVIGLAQYNRYPALAIDLGTAITYDFIDKNAEGEIRFLGGMIAPGLPTLRQCLHRNTAQLPPLPATPAQPCPIGHNTLEALQAGIMIGFTGMVKESLAALQRAHSQKIFIVATGGDAPYLQEQKIPIDIIDDNLTFKGLLYIAEEHLSK